jgi:hypothetical protein
MAVNERSLPPWAHKPEARVGAVVAVALALAFVVWLVVRGGDSGSSRSGQTVSVEEIGPVAVSPDRLRSLASQVGRPIYWLGALPDRQYEFWRTSQDRVYVRYLPAGVPVGTRRAGYTLVGTYPVKSAYAVLQALGKKEGENSLTAARGGFAVYSTARPTNVYLAFPGSDLQIEVYDPSPERARELVTSGQVVPVE